MHANKTSAADPAADREVTITRVFDAPARLLFEAHSKPQHVLAWFGPPGCPLALCEMDFRTGGRYRFAMKDPQGQLMTPFGGEYLEIIENKKISYSNTFESPGAETMVVTVTFAEHAGRTTVVIHTLFGSPKQRQEHMGRGYQAGVNAGLDQLGAVVAAMAVQP